MIQFERLFGVWLIGCLLGWFVCCLLVCLIDYVFGCVLFGGLFGCFVVRFIVSLGGCCLIGWMSDCLFALFVRWIGLLFGYMRIRLVCCLNGCFFD